MSVCDPKDPDACEKCKPRTVTMTPHSGRPAGKAPDPDRRAELEQMEAELKGLRLGARELKRSGNPEVRAEGKKALAHIEDQLAWVRGQLSKGEARG